MGKVASLQISVVIHQNGEKILKHSCSNSRYGDDLYNIPMGTTIKCSNGNEIAHTCIFFYSNNFNYESFSTGGSVK